MPTHIGLVRLGTTASGMAALFSPLFQSAISEAQVDRLRLVINDVVEGNKEGEADQKQIDRVSRSLNSHIKTRLRPSRNQQEKSCKGTREQ